MARRKRKEEEAIWEPPEFDEVGYMRKEIENAKIALVVIAWAAVGALLAFLLYALNQPIFGFLLGILIFGALYFLLPMIGLPIHGFRRRDWLGHASIYFFSWLAFSILLLNAPFGDHTAPVIGSFEAGSFMAGGSSTIPAANTVVCYPGTAGNTIHIPLSSNNSVYVIFRATDNIGVASLQVQSGTSNVNYTDVGGDLNVCVSSTSTQFLPGTYAVTIPNSGSAFLTITATDASGLKTTETISIASP